MQTLNYLDVYKGVLTYGIRRFAAGFASAHFVLKCQNKSQHSPYILSKKNQ